MALTGLDLKVSPIKNTLQDTASDIIDLHAKVRDNSPANSRTRLRMERLTQAHIRVREALEIMLKVTEV